ncbi:ATP--guanido phosphotransferase [bacterium]|nr:ATP--guanido phosphotransferase [bacterium]
MKGKKPAFPAWLRAKTTDDNKIVISTRIRLARNLAQHRFLVTSDKPERKVILGEFENFFSNTTLRPAMHFLRLRDLDSVMRGVFAERGLVHMDSAREPDFTGLATGPGQTLSLIVNEEDHIRIQSIQSGMNLEKGLQSARQLDEVINSTFEVATHKEFGYLSACPTNVGTGLRASVMLNLPALTLTRGIVQVLQAVLHMGLAVRGFYGEGTELKSVFFQVSNQVTLGRTEEEIVQHLAGVTRQIIDREEEARRKLLKEERHLLEDKVGRAIGILAHCHLLGLGEALDLLSAIRLGSELKLIKEVPLNSIHELLLLIQPSHLQMTAKQSLGTAEQLRQRAELVRKRLSVDFFK